VHPRPLRRLASWLAPLALLPALAAHAAVPSSWGEGAFDQGDARVEARLLLHPDRLADGRVRAGVLLSLDPGWHLYWKNPGETGLATRLTWHGGDAAPASWPAPSAFEERDGALVGYGYEGHVLLASELRPDAGARSLGVDVDLLACRTSCIPARLSLERALDAVDSGEAADAVRRLFELHEQSLPVSADSLGVALEASSAGIASPGEIALAVLPCGDPAPGQACAELARPPMGPLFFPERADVRVVDVRPHPEREGGLLVRLQQETGPTVLLRGVLELRGADGRIHDVAVDLAPSLGHARVGGGGLLAVLALGVLGGLLLNLMPCVLPVLALKAFAAAELAGRSRREALAHAAAHAAGVLATMLALAGGVLVLRMAGSEVGWGFQLQSPGYLVAISALLVVLALNLLGIFEIGFLPSRLANVGASAVGLRRSFLDGLLAVAVATPCSAPFLGTAVGFALASGGMLVVVSFLAIGCGLAAPFALISAFPIAERWLPRAGPWMAELRSVLGFALLATVVWLVWVLARIAGADAAAGLLALLLAIAMAAWSHGRLSRRELRSAVLAIGAVLVLAGANVITVEAAPPLDTTLSSGSFAEPWQPGAVERYLADGRPVFVYFTADWCLTCKFNESSVLSRPAVHAALARRGFAVLRADWTRRDESVRRELARLGRAGVPLYVVYRPGMASPEILPELLTRQGLLDALGPDVAAAPPGESDPVQGPREADAS